MAIVKKYVQKQDLSKYQTWITDTGPFSDYFKLAQFPDTLRAGKNGFLINGSANLVRTTDVKIEIIDSDGNTVFLQPIRNYSEGLARVISIEVYDDTPTGPALVTIMGEVAFDDKGNRAPSEWQGTYNVKWQKIINIEPNRTNNTPVRVYEKPELTISEHRVPVLTFQSGSINTIIDGSISGPYISIGGYGGGLPGGGAAPPAPDSLITLITATQPIFVANSLYGTLTATVGGTIYSGTITSITSTTKAYVSFGLYGTGSWYASSYSLVYQDPSTYTTGSDARSYVNMGITNLTTFTGDIQRAKVYLRGTDTDEVYSLLDDVILEAVELTAVLSDVGTYTSYGDIVTQGVADAYWESGILNNHTQSITNLTDYLPASPSVNVTASFNDSILHNSVVVTGPNTVNNNVWVGISQDLSVESGVDYALETTLTCVKSTNIPTQLQIRLYNSSSLNVAGGDKLGYLIETFDLGTPISKEFGAQQIAFTSPITDTQARLRFVTVGVANWHIADTRLTVASETGFNPSEISRIIELDGRENEHLQFKVELLDGAYSIVPITLESDPIFFTGSSVTSAAGGGSSLSASYAVTSSYTRNAVSASYFSGSALFPHGLTVTGSVSASGGFYGFLYGTASYALNGSSGSSVSSSYALTSSYARNAVTASYLSGTINFPSGLRVTGSITASAYTGSFTGSLLGSSSYALTASYAANAGGVVVSSSYALTSSYAANAINVVSSSYAVTSSYARAAATASYLSGTINFPNGLIVTGSVSASTGFDGFLYGTASYALTGGGGAGISASYALTASYASNAGGSTVSSSYALTSSYARTADTASYLSGTINFPNGLIVTGSVTASYYTGSLIGSSSYALTASYAMNGGGSGVSSSYASYAVTASYISGAFDISNGLNITGSTIITGALQVIGVVVADITGSIFGSSSYAISSSYAMSSSYAATARSSSYAISSSYAATARSSSYSVTSSYAQNAFGLSRSGSFTGSFTGSLLGSASYALTSSYASNAGISISSSYALTSSYTRTADTASYLSGTINFPNGLVVTGSVTASAYTGSFTGSLLGNATTSTSSSYALTASYAANAAGTSVSSSYALTSSWSAIASNATSSSYALTSSYARTAATASYLSGTINFPSGLIVTGSVTASVFSGSFTGSLLGSSSYAVTSSWSRTSLSSSAAGNFYVGGRADTKTSTAQVVALGNVAHSTSLDLTVGQGFSANNTGSTTFVFSSPPTGLFGFVLKYSSGSNVSPARSTVWPNTVRWTSGSTPALSSFTDVLGFVTMDAGSTWYGSHTVGKTS